MSKVSTELSARARNEVSRVLQALASSNQSQVAEQLGIDPSTLSRMKNDRKSNGLTELENCLVLLDILGFKTVLKKYRMISEEKLNALFVMSKAWMESKQTIDDLFQDDIEDFGMCFELGYKDQSQVAEQLGIDPSTLSRMKNDRKSNGLTELENCLVLLDILGFKTVLKKYRMISEEKLNALFVMSKAWMESKQTIDDLFQDDIEDFGMCFELGYKEKA